VRFGRKCAGSVCRLVWSAIVTSPSLPWEVPVQTCLELIDVLRVLHPKRRRKIDDAWKDGAVDGYGPVAEVQIVVFGLDRPVVADRPFDARAHCPADPVFAVGAGEERDAPAQPVVGVVGVRIGDAGLCVNQPAVMAMPIELVEVAIQLVSAEIDRLKTPSGTQFVVLVPLTLPQVISASVPTTSLPSW
jgi:hypothetical protein